MAHAKIQSYQLDNILPANLNSGSGATSTTFWRGDGVWAAPAGGGSIFYKDAVRAATTANITLSGNVTLDGITTVAGDRILVKNQTTASQNGIYVAAAGAWTRATDFDTTGTEVQNGCIIPVQFGTVNGGSLWQLAQNGGTIGNNFRFQPVSGIAAAGLTAWTTPVATGTNSIAIGNGAQGAGNNSIAIGTSVNAGSGSNVVIGLNSSSTNTSTTFPSTVIGISNSSGAAQQIVIGHNNTTGAANGVVAIGISCSASNTGAIAIGNGTLAAGNSFTDAPVAIGSNANTVTTSGAASFGPVGIGRNANTNTARSGVAVGNDATCNSNDASIALGNTARCDMPASFNIGLGRFAAAGDLGINIIAAYQTTTNATTTELGLSAGPALTTPTNRIVLTNDSSYIFDCDIIARNTATDTESKAWNLQFAIRRGAAAANTALIGSATLVTIGQDTGTTTWTVTATADTTNGRPNISVTGEAAKTIRWVANIRMTKVTG